VINFSKYVTGTKDESVVVLAFNQAALHEDVLASALGGDWSASRPGRFSPGIHL
jgi:hypothetical protein